MYDYVILMSLDTLRSDCINANPLKLWPAKYNLDYRLHTPVLDDLARSGAFFPNCISAAPYTSASHASFFTGKWPLRHGLYEFFNRKLRSKTIFTMMKGQGFKTIFKVDFPIILGDFLGFTKDIDHYIIEDDDIFLDSLDHNRRVFGFVHFGGLHVPYGFHNIHYGGQDYVNKVNELESEIKATEKGLADQLTETYRDAADLDLLLRYKRIVQYFYSIAEYRRLFLLYLEGVNFFFERRWNRFIERLLDKLKGKRFLLVIFGDHGEEYDDESYAHTNSLSEGVIRVPVIFYSSDVHARIHLDRIRSIDVVPTLLDILGLSAGRTQLDGSSLVDAVWGNSSYPVRSAFAQIYSSETKEFVEFQRRTISLGKKVGSLRHNLYKEAVYDQQFKLTRQHYRYTQDGGIWGMVPCEPRITLEIMDRAYHWHPHSDSQAEEQLLEQLDSYNRIRRTTSQKVDVTEDIRRQLQNMGYRI